MEDKKYDVLKLENQLCFPLYAAARQIVNLYNPAFKPLGLTYTEYIVFMVLWEHENGVTVGELGQILYLNNSTLTPLLKRMESEDYIKRIRCNEDERVVNIYLTQKGWEMRDKALDIPAKVGKCVKLSEEKVSQLYSLLYELMDVLAKEE